jgi:hypothetical protein
MGNLKKSIVIVSEFTVKTAGGGSRGATPGRYVTRYMAREGATEPIDRYVQSYMSRPSATEAINSVTDGSISPYDGVAFGDDAIALDAKKLKEKSKTIQDAFDNGKTVLKTVLSFETEYLKEKGVLPPDFEMTGRGAAKGHLDQQKLRMAIMDGLKRMSFDIPCYVGVLQVDTAHVHCHLAIADLGVGTLRPDGQQKGMISEKDKRKLRQGIEMALDEYQASKQACADYESAEELAIKATMMHAFAEEGFTQAFIAALPDDKSVWRANTNRKDMRLANTLLYDFTKTVLTGSNAYDSARKYAERLAQDKTEYEAIYDHYVERMTKKCMNAVYTKLKATPLQLEPATPFMAGVITGEGCQFSASLRRYQSAKIAHKNRAKMWNNTAEMDNDEDIVALAESERRYHIQCMLKYVMLLPNLEMPPDNFELLKAQNLYYSTKQMGNDPDFLSLQPDEAEKLGIQRYGVANGSLVGTEHWDMLLDDLKMHLNHVRREYSIDCMFAGINIDGSPLKIKYESLRCLDLCDVSFTPTADELEQYRLQTLSRRRLADKARLIVDDIDKACDYIGQKSFGGYTKPIVQLLKKDTQYIGEQRVDDVLSERKQKSNITVKTTPFKFSMNDDFAKTILNEFEHNNGKY